MSKKMMLRVVLWIITIFISGALLDFSMGWMSEKNDIKFWGGLILTTVLVIGWIGVLTNKGKKWYANFKEKNSVKTLLVLFGAIIALQATGCSRIGPGYVGIEVKLAGGQRGVQDFPLCTGWVFYNAFVTDVLKWPTFVQTAVWSKNPDEGSPNNEEITFNSKEGLIISADISLSYSMVAEKVPAFYVKFRTDDMNQFTHGFCRNIARDSFNEAGIKFTVEEIYGEKKDILLNEIKKRISDQLAPFGVNIDQFGLIGAFRIPPGVTEALNAKIKATQNAIQAENELRQSKADAQKLIAKSMGEAEANLVLAASITPELIKWRQLQIAEQTIARWDGKRPMVEGAGSNLLFSMPLPQ